MNMDFNMKVFKHNQTRNITAHPVLNLMNISINTDKTKNAVFAIIKPCSVAIVTHLY